LRGKKAQGERKRQKGIDGANKKEEGGGGNGILGRMSLGEEGGILY